MASAATIGALRVTLGADTASFESGLKSAETRAAAFGASLTKVFGGIAIGAALAGVAASIKHTSEEIDKLGKTAQSIGIPIEELSKLKYAADLSGTSLEGLSVGVGKLSKNMSEFAGGGGEEAGRAFRAIGLSVTDASGNLRLTSDVMVDIAGKFANMQDGAGKTALAMSLFGKSGKDLIPLLNSGADGLKQMYQEAEQLGLVISGDTFKAAEAFNDNLTRLGKIWEGLSINLTAALLPGLQTLSGMLVNVGKNMSGTVRESGAFAGFVDEIIRQIAILDVTIRQVTDTFSVWGKVLSALKNLDFAGVNAAAEGFAALYDRAKNLNLEIAKTVLGWRLAGQAALNLAGDKGIKAPVLASVDLQKSLDTLTVKALDLQHAFANVAPGFAEQAIALKLLTPAQIAQAGAIQLTNDQLIQLNDRMLAVKGAQLTEESLLPWDSLKNKVTELNLLMESGKISAFTYQEQLKKAADSAGLSFKMASTSIAGSFVEIANGIGGTSSRIAKIAQATAAAVALINTLAAESYALAGPFPANLIALATVAAKGAALYAAINSTQIPAFAAGGSFVVPGGISKVDNRMIPMALAAGERVDITPANQVGKTVTIDVAGLGRDSYRRDEVIKILDGLNDLLDDNYKLRIN